MKKATLLANFETKTIQEEQVVDGKKVKVDKIIPKYKEGRESPIEVMDYFWMMESERGGLCVVIGPMDYVRITYPDGSKTKYYDLFSYE